MDTSSRRPKEHDGILSALGAAINVLTATRDCCSIPPAGVVFGSVIALLTMIRDSMANEQDYVELALGCADICQALDRGVNGKELCDLSPSLCGAIGQLTTTVAEIQREIIKRSGRSAFSRLFHSKNDKEMIVTWNKNLNRILLVFNAELAINTHMMISGFHRRALTGQGGADGQHPSTKVSTPPGELPPPPLGVCFGRDDVIEEVVRLAENPTSLALIGPGGIGKTSIALAVLHHDRIKKRYGDNRWFIRCDQFPASRTHFLNRISKVTGAGVKNAEDLIPLRPFLSSREMIILLDNAESILDPQGTNAQEIYTIVMELSQFRNICLCFTSRISIVPPACELLDIPTLSMEAAHNTFYRIYKGSRQSDLVNRILQQLDFHPLSITLLATVAYHNKWDTGRLAREWKRRRTGVLHTQHNESLAKTIELSLASPMFQGLGPSACDLLGVIAFFPRGINEDNLNWLFPALPNRMDIIDNLCILSLTYRIDGFIRMLAPLRDYFYPKDPSSSPLLLAIKEIYFSRLSVDPCPGKCGFYKSQWVASEDVNVEHLFDVFTSIDDDSKRVWDACAQFMTHLYWQKRRLVILGPKIEGLSDDHPSKPLCLVQLSWLFNAVGNNVEYKRLLIHALKLWREQRNDFRAADSLRYLSDANRLLGLREEGMRQARESLEIYKQLDSVWGEAHALQLLGRLLHENKELDAAEQAISQAIDLLLGGKEPIVVCRCYRTLGDIYFSKGEMKKAISHFEMSLKLASSFNWYDEQFWNHHSMAQLSFKQGRPDDAQTHANHAKSHAVDDAYLLGHAIQLQADLWYKQQRFREAESEALQAAEVFERFGAMEDLDACRVMLQAIGEAMSRQAASHKLGSNAQGAGCCPPGQSSTKN